MNRKARAQLRQKSRNDADRLGKYLARVDLIFDGAGCGMFEKLRGSETEEFSSHRAV